MVEGWYNGVYMETTIQKLEALNQKFLEGTLTAEEALEYQKLFKEFSGELVKESSETLKEEVMV